MVEVDRDNGHRGCSESGRTQLVLALCVWLSQRGGTEKPAHGGACHRAHRGALLPASS